LRLWRSVRLFIPTRWMSSLGSVTLVFGDLLNEIEVSIPWAVFDFGYSLNLDIMVLLYVLLLAPNSFLLFDGIEVDAYFLNEFY